MQTIEAQVLYRPESEELRFLPEGPIAAGEDRFTWVGIQHGPESRSGSLNLFDLSTGTNGCFPLSGRPGFALPTHQPTTWLVGLERRLSLFDIRTGKEEELLEGVDEEVENTIINDGVAFDGGAVFGCKELTFTKPQAGLYFWRQRDNQLFRLRDDQICSNGKVVLATEQGVDFLDIDTPTKQVVRYRLDVEAGTLSPPTVVLDLHDVAAFPDGMIAAPDGRSVIIAFFNPEQAEYGETRQYNLETGACETIWRTPGSPRNTCPLLIEHHGGVKLVITTADEGMPPEMRGACPQAGSLFIAETGFDRTPATFRLPL